jgi:hypothetical protein
MIRTGSATFPSANRQMNVAAASVHSGAKKPRRSGSRLVSMARLPVRSSVIGRELTPQISPITLSTVSCQRRHSVPAALLPVPRQKSRTRAPGVASNPLLRHHRRGSTPFERMARLHRGKFGLRAFGGLCGFGHVKGFQSLPEDVHGDSVLGLELGLFSEIKRAIRHAGPRPQFIGQGHRSVSAITS